jgi:hypothetical protein
MASVTNAAERAGPSLRLAQVRGADEMPVLDEGVVRVEIVGLFDTNARYSITLDYLEPHKPAETLTSIYGQHPSSPMTLEFMLDSDRLQAGSYTLRVRKQASDEEPLDFGILKR